MLIDRYIIKELIQSFLISIVGLNLLLMMEKVLKLSRVMAGIGASFTDISGVILLLQPQLLVLTIPMAFLLSILLTFGRLGFDNELIVLRTSGLSFKRISRPVAYLSVILFIASIITSTYLMPWALKRLRTDVNTMLREKAPLSIEPGIFFTAFKNIVLLINNKDSPGKFEGVFIYDGRDRSAESVIVAREGEISIGEKGIGLELKDGTIHNAGKKESTEIHFSSYNFNILISSDLIGRKKGEMTPFELYSAAKKEKGNPAGYYIELYRRFSYPALIFSIALLAPALSLLAGKTGRTGGFVVGMSIFALYYIAMVYVENLVKTNRANHLICWLPFAVLTTISFILYRRTD